MSNFNGNENPSQRLSYSNAANDECKETLLDVITQATTFVHEMTEGAITVDGDAGALLTIFGNLEKFVTGFAIVEP
jgi:alkyl sulfatase BDS1-like metallo-beta-lactamase superfamily hydrolase